MERNINLFTALIFAYSIVVCTVCKKDVNKQDSFSTNQLKSIQDKELTKVIITKTNPSTIEYPVMAVNTVTKNHQ